MKYRYGFVTGNETVEVPEEWAAVLREMDQEEMNNGRRETRRHSSLEKLLEEGVDFAAPGNAESVLMENEYSPETEKALDCLTETQIRPIQATIPEIRNPMKTPTPTKRKNTKKQSESLNNMPKALHSA